MKKYVKTSNDILNDTIHVIMYLHPLIYEDSEVMYDDLIASAVSYDKHEHRYHTDINPFRLINGSLSGPGEELENPVAEEWESFIDDCKWLINEVGFTIISSERSTVSNKSEYVFIYGVDDTPCGTVIFDLRISDHPFDAKFPEAAKDKVLEYLKMNKILDGDAAKAGIDFVVEQVLVSGVKHDSWDRAFNRLFHQLKVMRRRVQARLHDRSD